MKRPYGQFLVLTAFKPCKNARRAVVEKIYKVVVANKGVEILPVYAAHPFAVKVFRSHFVWLFAQGVF